MKKNILILAFVASSLFTRCWGATVEMPSFLPNYYRPVFQMNGKEFALISHVTKKNVDQWSYATHERSQNLIIENINCNTPRSKGIFHNITNYLNDEISRNKGEFQEITKREIHAEIINDTEEKSVFVYAIPTAIQLWTYSRKQGSRFKTSETFRIIRNLVNRQRYEEALREGNVSMGTWGNQIYEYASGLLQEGKKKKALTVFDDLLATTPYNYEAHVSFMETSKNPQSAMNSAMIVLRNAEDNYLINKAAKFLKTHLTNYHSLPKLEAEETGLQLILVPFEPCNILLLEESARIFEQIAGIKTKIRRLPETWDPKDPDRIHSQRRVQEILIKLSERSTDFIGWSKYKYIGELRKHMATKDALTQYYLKDLINKIKKEPGQYFVDPHLKWFCEVLQKYRSTDHRTLYVGVTELNIYSGDNNYVFSYGRTGGPSRASILSYHMMLAKTLSETYESRQRLTERIAKELVPAALKQLGIPRSTDPTCPYSYSSGVSRLDQKTLTLSTEVKETLKELAVDSGRGSHF